MDSQKFEFKEYTFEQFNKEWKTDIESKMDLEELTDWLEKDEIGYLYASYDPNDVITEYKDFLNEIGHTCDLVDIEGRYLALL